MSDERAARACSTCRRQKRRCTKEIPECSLCRKSGRHCDYSIHGLPTSPPREVSTLAPAPSRLTDFPALFFLDSSYFQQENRSLERQCLSLPQELMGRLSGLPQMRYDVDVFFNSVHTFFPIVSKLRLYKELSSAEVVLNADTTLLLVTMQLHTLPVDNTESPYRELYRTAKDCLSYVEGSNIFSIRLLQAALLIALYEVSNAMYPAAYLSVGHCARLGHAMGIHDRRRAPQMLSSPSKFSPAGEAIGLGPDQDSETATELEERRRVWWAVIILDRYVNLGSKNRPFACEDARPDEYLPADDKHWDQGELALVQPLAFSTSTAVQAPPFARTCQAAHLLSRVLRNLNDSDTDAEFRFQEAIQLHRTTQALYSTALHESEELVERMSDLTAHLPFSAAMGLCLSALLTLYDKYSCTENSEVDQMGSPNLLEMQKIAISGLKELSSAVFQLSRRIRAAAELGGMLKTSPLICDCLYQAAANYLWYILETGNEECRSMVVGIKDVLQMLGTRWKSPIEYIRILDSYEMSQGLAM